MNKLTLFLLIITTMTCSHNNLKVQLIGKWISVYDDKQSIEFFEDGQFIIYNNGENFLKNTEFDSLSFSVKQQTSFIELIIKDKNDKLFSREKVHLVDNELVRVCFKQGKDINHHIDEFSFYRRENSQLSTKNKNSSIQKYVIPKDYRGTFLIIYDFSYGEKPEYDANGNEVFRIPNNGILKTQSSATPFKTAKKELSFYELTSSNELIPLSISDNKNESLIKNENKVYVKIDGYNQLARDEVNEILKEPFDSNIIFFSVDLQKKIESNNLYSGFVNSFKSN